MESIRVIPDLEKTGFSDEPHEVIEYTGPLIVGGKADGTENNKPSVLVAFEVGDEEWLVKETTLSLFLTAADTLRARYGDPRPT